MVVPGSKSRPTSAGSTPGPSSRTRSATRPGGAVWARVRVTRPATRKALSRTGESTRSTTGPAAETTRSSGRSTSSRSSGTASTTARLRAAPVVVPPGSSEVWVRATSSSTVIVEAMVRQPARTSVTSSRSSSSRSSRMLISSAVACTAVSGVRSSWASSAVSRCSARMALATRSSNPSRVAPSARISSVGGPRSNRRSRSCSLHSRAVSAITWTGARARRLIQAATAVASRTISRPADTDTASAACSSSSYGVNASASTTTPAVPSSRRNGRASTEYSSATSSVRSRSLVESRANTSPSDGGTLPATLSPSAS
jgi:hypothetical protein